MPSEDAYALSRAPRPQPGPPPRAAELKRQVFEAFHLKIDYDKVDRRIEISATVTEAVAQAFEKPKTSRRRSQRRSRDIAGAGFEPATFGL